MTRACAEDFARSLRSNITTRDTCQFPCEPRRLSELRQSINATVIVRIANETNTSHWTEHPCTGAARSPAGLAGIDAAARRLGCQSFQ